MLCAKFGWNWPGGFGEESFSNYLRGSGEEDENLRSLQQRQQQQRRRTTDNSLDTSAQVS